MVVVVLVVVLVPSDASRNSRTPLPSALKTWGSLPAPKIAVILAVRDSFVVLSFRAPRQNTLRPDYTTKLLRNYYAGKARRQLASVRRPGTTCALGPAPFCCLSLARSNAYPQACSRSAAGNTVIVSSTRDPRSTAASSRKSRPRPSASDPGETFSGELTIIILDAIINLPVNSSNRAGMFPLWTFGNPALHLGCGSDRALFA